MSDSAAILTTLLFFMGNIFSSWRTGQYWLWLTSLNFVCFNSKFSLKGLTPKHNPDSIITLDWYNWRFYLLRLMKQQFGGGALSVCVILFELHRFITSSVVVNMNDLELLVQLQCVYSSSVHEDSVRRLLSSQKQLIQFNVLLNSQEELLSARQAQVTTDHITCFFYLNDELLCFIFCVFCLFPLFVTVEQLWGFETI